MEAVQKHFTSLLLDFRHYQRDAGGCSNPSSDDFAIRQSSANSISISFAVHVGRKDITLLTDDAPSLLCPLLSASSSGDQQIY